MAKDAGSVSGTSDQSDRAGPRVYRWHPSADKAGASESPSWKPFVILRCVWQIPEVEAREAELLQSIPATSEPALLYKQLEAHDSLATRAAQICKRVREGTADREFNWKARVTDVDGDEVVEPMPPKYTNEAIGRFLREGALG